MDAAVVERLVRELIATGTMWPETIEDLERFAAEARAGTLSRDDYDYLVAFHAKSVLSSAPGSEALADAGEFASQQWSDRLRDAEERAERAERRLADLEAGHGSPAQPDGRFDLLKQRLAERFPLGGQAGAGLDAQVRASITREVWALVEEAERAGHSA